MVLQEGIEPPARALRTAFGTFGLIWKDLE